MEFSPEFLIKQGWIPFQAYANMQTVTMFVCGIPPVIFSLMIGPWSDNFGRKMLMLFPMSGYIAYMSWLLINVIFFDQMVAEWLMFVSVMENWPGGWIVVFLGAYSYVSDNSSPEFRTARIAIFDCVTSCAFALGPGAICHCLKISEFQSFMFSIFPCSSVLNSVLERRLCRNILIWTCIPNHCPFLWFILY